MFPSLLLVICDILQRIVQLSTDIHIAPLFSSTLPITPRLPRHILQPTPLDLHPSQRDIRQLGKRVLRDIEIPCLAPDTAIDDLEIHAYSPTRALDAHALAAQRVRVGIGAGADGVEEEVRDGNDRVTVCRCQSARPQAGCVVGQVAGVGSAVGGGEGQVLGVRAVGEAGGEADDEDEEEGGAEGEEEEGAVGEGAPGSGSGSAGRV